MSQPQPWTDENLAALEREETWDHDTEVPHQRVDNPRAQVHVQFSSGEFGTVARAAEARGVSVTSYIRAAAIELANWDATVLTSTRRGED